MNPASALQVSPFPYTSSLISQIIFISLIVLLVFLTGYLLVRWVNSLVAPRQKVETKHKVEG